jgi:membrane fusion protein (multidrug efflux system)
VVRTREALHLDSAGIDPRYDCDIDNPGGSEDARFIAEPILGDPKSVAGAVIAVRNGPSASFSADDRRVLALLAGCAAPVFSQILLQDRLQALLPKQTGLSRPLEAFRVEAAENHLKTYDEQSDMFQTLPKWLKRAQWALVGLVLVSLLGGLFGKVNEYTSGPAVIRGRGKVEVTAKAPGRVCSVEVSVGDRVKAGDTLVRLDGAIGPTASEGNRGQVLARENGIVGEIHVHSGQFVNPGDQVMTIVRDQAPYDLVSFLPSSYAPKLRPGMPLEVRFRGGPRSPQVMPMDSVGPEFPTLREAARYAGVEDFKGSGVGGPVVMVRSFLRSTKLTGEAGSNFCHDGVTGEVDVRIRSEPIIISILPSLKRIFGMGK